METLPETHMFAPENWWLEYYFPFKIVAFQVSCQTFGVYGNWWAWFNDIGKMVRRVG